ncbi:MAG: S8 family peptidase [bacterium]|nr:S8 family peptidase [bacterium]
MYLFLAFLALVPASSVGRIPILLPNRGMSNNTTILYSSSKAVLDTLMPTLAAPFSGLNTSDRVEYEATKFTPASACTITAVMHGVTGTGSSSKQCSVFVWSDASGNIGTKLFGTAYNASFGGSNLWDWNTVTLPSPIAVTGAFWVGNREWTASDPTTVLDQTLTSNCPTKYNFGSGWNNDVYDYAHAAVVKYASTGTPSINVTPSYVIFQIDSNPPKSFTQKVNPPAITENNPKYWENIVSGELLVGYKSSVDAKKASLTELGLTQKEIIFVNRDIGSNIILIKTTANLEQEKALLASLKSHSNISFVEPNRTGKLEATPNDPLYGTYQWDKVNMNAPTGWDYGFGSTSISIGVIDCGIEYTHEDLVDRFTTTKGYDYMDNDNDPAPGTSEQHGTACAGIAAATINNAKGIAGVANARLYALRAANATTPDIAKVAQSIQWCIDNGVKIISMSLSFDAGSTTLQTKCDAAWAAGIVLFAASGNNGAETIRYPAGYSSVIAVGSITKLDARSSFSNYGTHLDLVAPGGAHTGTQTDDIGCPIPGNQYTTGWGTSFATPNAAGAAALIWSLKSSLSNQQLRDLMQNTATDLGTTGWDKEYGYGKVNIAAALTGGTVTPDTGTINVQNLSSATSDLDVSNITYKSSWVQSVSPKTFTVSVGNSQAVTIIVQGSLHTGYYYDTLSIASNDNAHTPYKVPLILRVGDVGIEESNVCIQRFNLKVSPNPTSRFLSFSFNIPTESNITLEIFDATGRMVKTIANNVKFSGEYNAKISTAGLSSGIYFVSLKAGDTRISKKVTLIQ